MDVVIPIALLIVGLVIGFFVARHLYTQNHSAKANEQAEKAVKELMAQQAQHHLHQVRQAVADIEKQCSSLKQDMSDYEQLLNQSIDEDNPRVPFYGEQASTYLRNNLKGSEKVKLASSSDTQPKDFAQSGSGLFVGSAGASTAEKE